MTELQTLNQSLFLWLNHACAALPEGLWSSLTITGHTSMIFALFAPLLLPQWRNRGGSQVVTALLICSLVGGLAATVLKESFQVMRPPAVLAADRFYLIGHKLELVSFPSGHTLTAFAVAALLIVGLGLRGWRMAVCLLVASAIGVSRIAVGAHWPLDVVVGAIVGGLCGYVSLIAANYCHQRYTWPSHFAYQLLQMLLLLGVAASLLGTPMGYPSGVMWQLGVAASGIITSLYCIFLHLLTLKAAKKLLKG